MGDFLQQKSNTQVFRKNVYIKKKSAKNTKNKVKGHFKP